MTGNKLGHKITITKFPYGFISLYKFLNDSNNKIDYSDQVIIDTTRLDFFEPVEIISLTESIIFLKKKGFVITLRFSNVDINRSQSQWIKKYLDDHINSVH